MKKRIVTYITIAMSLVACTTDDGDQQQQGQQTVALAAPVEEWHCGTTATRAPSFNDFNQNYPVTGKTPTTISVWGYNDSGWMKNAANPPEPLQNVEFTYEAEGDKLYHKGTWNQSTEQAGGGAYPWGNGGTYSFYAVAPYNDNSATDFDKATQTLTLPFDAVGKTDYMVAKEIKSHATKTDGAVVKFTQTDYQFKHITACIQLAFALDSRYAKNRYLNIKTVKATVGGVGGQATYTYNLNNKSESLSGGEMTNTEPLPLTTTEEPWYIGDNPNMHVSDKYHAYGHFYVMERYCDEAPIKLEVEYDVYDLNGMMTRKGVTTTSTVTLGNYVTTIREGKKCLKAGYYYNVLIYIIPDYLYVLSDNDNGSDTVIKIETR